MLYICRLTSYIFKALRRRKGQIDYFLHGSMRVIKQQLGFAWNISYLRVLFLRSKLLLTFWYINNKKIKLKECIHVTPLIFQIRS
jgi:hypothetical protein